jgi:hypothetical protein
MPAPDATATPKPTGREVIRKMEAVRGRGDGAAKRYELRLIDRGGAEARRVFTLYRKRCGLSVRSLVLVHEPPDMTGTSVLTWSHSDRTPDMWLYLPELGRIRQLNAFAQSDSFLGSDLSYGDLVPIPIDLRRHRLLRRETLTDRDTWVVESTPTAPERYSRIVTWIDTISFLPVRIAYFDSGGTALKTGRIEEARTIQGITTPARLLMENVQQDHKTVLTLLNAEFDAPLGCERFTTRYLRRRP